MTGADGVGSTVRRVRVVIAAPSLHQFLGGQEVQADQLLRNWQGDEQVDARLVESNPSLPGPLRVLERAPVLRTLLRLPLRVARLWRATRNADVVHVFAGAHSSYVVGSLPAVGVAMLLGRPYIVHYHNCNGEEHLARSWLARATFRRSASVVVPSRYLRDAFARHGVAAQVIANAIDEVRFPPRSAAAVARRIVCTRNLDARYAIDDVLRTFALVQKVFPDATLLLAGRGPAEGELRRLAAGLGLSGVTFAGAVDRDDMGPLLAEAAVMINASRVDNMPVSILEAFAVGVPVVTTNAGGIPTFARHGETALVAAVGDVEQLAFHVCAVLRDASLAARLVAGARMEAERCGWPALRASWWELYSNLLTRAEHSRA